MNVSMHLLIITPRRQKSIFQYVLFNHVRYYSQVNFTRIKESNVCEQDDSDNATNLRESFGTRLQS